MAPTLDLPQDSPTAANSWMVGDGHALPAVVGPLDGSEASRLTTAVAARLARRMAWRLALVPVPLGATAEDRRDRLVAAALDERAGLIATPATNSASADGPGAPACLALADTAPCAVLAVPLTRRWRPTAGSSVVCGVDGSQRSAAAARTAARLAMALGARLELVHVADLVLEVGEPAGRLSAIAESKRALLVIGASANATAEHGVASTLMAKSHVPVVLVPGPQ